MVVPVRNATSASDIVVNLVDVSKTFHQRQRAEHLRDVWRGLLRPTIREVRALQHIDLQIRRGEIVAYAGPNGAGKSTTVKLLSSMLAPDSGSVRVLGMDPIRDRVQYVNRIGVVFGQRTELWWDHPVAASYEWKRVVWNIPRDRYDRMLGLVKELLGLNEFFNSLARELSLGQKMRADMGLALLHEPEILFLDEPTLGLDVLAKRNMLQFVKDLNRERQVTVMLTSHDMLELEQLAGRVVMVDRGRIAFDGDWARLRREFSDRRRLLIETSSAIAPLIDGAELVKSEAGRHEYVFDASSVKISVLLQQAAAHQDVLDVETHRAPIDEVIADIYQKWQRGDQPPAEQPALSSA
jgi:ABC-2 type transport system ATP-binding protein